MSTSTPCILFEGALTSDGYGALRVAGVLWRAHRYEYFKANGPIPKGMVVRHTCDNPACINLDHLLLGSQKQNMQDKVERNRCQNNKGELHGNSKLTDDDIRYIRNVPRAKYINTTLAKQFNIAESTVSCIRRGHRWSHVV